jgi:hypothetical protein
VLVPGWVPFALPVPLPLPVPVPVPVPFPRLLPLLLPVPGKAGWLLGARPAVALGGPLLAWVSATATPAPVTAAMAAMAT